MSMFRIHNHHKKSPLKFPSGQQKKKKKKKKTVRVTAHIDP